MSASTSTAVCADTTSYLPDEMYQRYGIKLVSLYVGVEGDQRKESELLEDLDDFYDRLKAAEGAVTTSQPSVGDILQVWEPILDDGSEIVSVHISAGISGTYEAATQARKQLTTEGKGGERVHLVDSRTAAGGTGLVLVAAANAVAGGASAAEAAAKAEQARKDLKIYFAVDTLEYLRRGGRIGSAGAWIGSTLKIKPILTFEEEVTPVEKVRTRAKSVERLVGYMKQQHENGKDAWVVQHIQAAEAAEEITATCKEFFGRDPVYTSEIGPVLGAHAGPGLLGVGATSAESLGL